MQQTGKLMKLLVTMSENEHTTIIGAFIEAFDNCDK